SFCRSRTPHLGDVPVNVLPDAVGMDVVRWTETGEVVSHEEPGFVLPVGTVTLLLADIEGSTALWETKPEEMTGAIARLDELITELIAVNAGVRPVEQGEGDSFVAAFARASEAVACALDIGEALAAEGWPFKVRMGLHTGEVQRRD